MPRAGNQFLALTRDASLDTQSSDISAEEIRYINDISVDIESEIRLFADDCVCYREIKNEEDTLKLQRDIDRLCSLARKWGMSTTPLRALYCKN